MIETVMVFGVVGLLVMLGVTAFVLSVQGLLIAGAACVAAGFLVGVPAGTIYHVKLYRVLALRGPVPRAFWLRPTSFHGEVEPEQWRGILPWFALGGTGFALIVLGCIVVMLGVWRA